MSPPTPLIRLSRPRDAQSVPLRARAGPNIKLPPSIPTVSVSVSSTSSSSSSSTVPQTSSQTSSSSVRTTTATTDAITTSSSTSSPTSSPETSSSALSTTPAPVQPTSSVLTPSNDVTVTVTSSVAQSSQPSIPPPTQASHTSFLQNKPAMIAVFSVAGVVALIVVILLATAVVRRRRRERLIEEAIDFSPTADHLIDVYNDGRSDNDEKGGTGSSLQSISGSTSRRAYPLSPSLLPPPVPPLRDAQHQGPGTGFAGSGISYENSSYAYYDTGRPQWQQQPQQQLLPPQQQQPSWRQQQAEWVQQQDFQSDVRHPSVLVPAHHQVATQASQIPFSSQPARASPPPGVTGGLRGLGPNQNEYMRAPSPAARETLRRGGGRL